MGVKFLQNNNSNMLCAIDIETTGDEPGFHDIVQVAVLPLDSDLNPWTGVTPFYTDLKLKRPENAHDGLCFRNSKRVKKERIVQAQLSGIDPDKAADLLEEWFEKLNLGLEKRIMPLAHNWASDRCFMIDWLGIKNFAHIFDARYRDTQVVGLYLNDVSEFKVEQPPFPKVRLQYMTNVYRIPHERAHDALQDCMVTAQLYKQILKEAS